MITQFVVGIIGPPFGLKGYVKVRSLSGETEHLLSLDTVTLRHHDRERVFQIDAVEERGAILLMKFQGINAPEEAKSIQGAELIVPRGKGAALGADEYYVEDLRGIRIQQEDGTPVGTVLDVLEGGGGNLLEVALSQGGIRLVPFRSEFLGDIDLEGGYTTLLAPWILE